MVNFSGFGSGGKLHAANMEHIQKGLAGIDMRMIGSAVLQISALPMVSQALKWRTRFWSFNIFLTEKAKAIVTACITMLVTACITISPQSFHTVPKEAFRLEARGLI